MLLFHTELRSMKANSRGEIIDLRTRSASLPLVAMRLVCKGIQYKQHPV